MRGWPYLRPPLWQLLCPPTRAGCSSATAERWDPPPPSLSYLHPQLRGAVLLEHRIGQLLQKSIFRAHQLSRERRRPTDVWAQQSRWRAWGSGHRPKTARLPGFPLPRAGRRLPREGSARPQLRAQNAPAPVLSAQRFLTAPDSASDGLTQDTLGKPLPVRRRTQLPGSQPAQPPHQSETGKEPSAHLLVGASFRLRGRLPRLVQNAALPPTTPQPEKRASEPQRAQRTRQTVEAPPKRKGGEGKRSS